MIAFPSTAAAARRIKKLRSEDTPVAIVIVSWPYRRIVNNWVTSYRKACEDSNFVVVCLDWRLWFTMKMARVPAVRIHQVKTRRQFWSLRTELLRDLCDLGVPFIHSDADAVWLADPRPYLSSLDESDLIFSQGTIHPFEAYERWQMTLCAGFFSVKPSARTSELLHAIAREIPRAGDDQAAINKVLMRRGLEWNQSDEGYFVGRPESPIRCWAMPLWGQLPGGERVTLLPQELFCRIFTTRTTGTLVFHPNTPSVTRGKFEELEKLGGIVTP